METRHANLTIVALIAATLVCDYILNPHLPAIIPSHWNIHGQADSFMSKKIVYLFSIGTLLLYVLLLNIIPRLPSRLPSVQPFLPTFNYMIVIAAIFMAYADAVALQIVLHPALPINKFILTGVLLLFMLLGNVLGKTRRNPWSGIRTPWTLASDANWIAANRLVGRLWVAVCLAGLILLWLGLPLPLLLVTVLLPLIIIPFLCPYLLSRRAQENGEGPA